MIHEKIPQTILVPNKVVQEALSDQHAAAPFDIDPAHFTLAAVPEKNDDRDQTPSRLGKIVALATGVATTGYLFLAGTGEANAAHAETVTAQTAEQNTPLVYGTLIVGAAGIAASTAVSAVSRWRQTRENADKEFNATVANMIANIKNDSGRVRVLPLVALHNYAEQKRFAPLVHRAMAGYLRDRRADLEELWEKHGEDRESFERDLVKRRYADREAFLIYMKTLPSVRKKVRGPDIKGRVKRAVGADELYEIEKITDTLPTEQKARISAPGINLDYMRGIHRVDLHGMDLTGAGLQHSLFTNVSFRDASLVEAQLEGSMLKNCSLIDTDARAAYWDGALITRCIINKNTKLGNLPKKHAKATHSILDPERPDDFRGNPRVILQDLIPAEGMTHKEFIDTIHAWQQNGLELLEGSEEEYFYRPDAEPQKEPAS